MMLFTSPIESAAPLGNVRLVAQPNTGLEISNDVAQHCPLSVHLICVACEQGVHGVRNLWRWGRRLTAELEQSALNRVALPQQRFQVRQHIDHGPRRALAVSFLYAEMLPGT